MASRPLPPKNLAGRSFYKKNSKMSLVVATLRRYRPISSGTSISLRTTLDAHKRAPSIAKNVKNTVLHHKSTLRVPLRRWYCQKVSEKAEEISEPVTSAAPKPASTTMPKSIHHLQNPDKATSDIGEIQIGSDGVVIPPKKAPSAAAANFTARRPSMSQEEVLKRMKEIELKSRPSKEDKESPRDGSRKKPAKLPQVIIYTHPTRELANIANAVACIASVRFIRPLPKPIKQKFSFFANPHCAVSVSGPCMGILYIATPFGSTLFRRFPRVAVVASTFDGWLCHAHGHAPRSSTSRNQYVELFWTCQNPNG